MLQINETLRTEKKNSSLNLGKLAGRKQVRVENNRNKHTIRNDRQGQ